MAAASLGCRTRLAQHLREVDQAMLDTRDIVLSDPRLKADPYPLYARMRAEAPVCRVRYVEGGRPVWLVTRYDDVVCLLKDERVVNNRRNAPVPSQPVRLRVLWRLFWPVIDHMLGADEPDHVRLRGLVQQAFTPRRIEALRARVEALTDELLDRAARQGEWDVVADYAVPVPSTIIAEMLGVPVADRGRFNRWTNMLVSASATQWLGMLTNAPKFLAFMRYLRGLIERRRARPQDDLISALVEAEEAGDKLSDRELLSMVLLLLMAGYETTANLIGTGTLALLENPEQLELLRAHPDLVAQAVEEFARYYSPVDYATFRYARTAVTIGGTDIAPGEAVLAALSSANRDAAQFARPDALDICREPNRHLGFGHGAHYCLGAFLARMEAQIAFTALLRRFPGLRLAVPRERLRWRHSVLLRGLEALPVGAGAARARVLHPARRAS